MMSVCFFVSFFFRELMRKLVKHKKISGALVIAVPFGKYRKTPQSGTIIFILVYLTIANSNNFVVSKK